MIRQYIYCHYIMHIYSGQNALNEEISLSDRIDYLNSEIYTCLIETDHERRIRNLDF